METIVSVWVLGERAGAHKTPIARLCLPPQNAEILTLTYGSIVRQLISDYEDVEEVNKQLDKM